MQTLGNKWQASRERRRVSEDAKLREANRKTPNRWNIAQNHLCPEVGIGSLYTEVRTWQAHEKKWQNLQDGSWSSNQTDMADGEHIQTEEKIAEKKDPVTPKKSYL